MELRGQDKDMGMASSFSYNNHLNRDSSSKVYSSSEPINSALGERRRDQAVHGDTKILNPRPPQTLDQYALHHPELNPHDQYQPRRDLDQDPDRVSAPLATTSATVTAKVDRSSSLKSPRQQSPASEAQPLAAGQTSTTISGFTALIRYRECLKNHAANRGGHVVDGCGEFMPSGEEGTPEALRCAACECHRNFHRKEINGESQYAPSCYHAYHPNKNNTRRNSTLHPPQLHLQQQTPLHRQRFSLGLSVSPSTVPIAPVMMNFGGGGGGNYGGTAESSSEDLDMFHWNAGGQLSAHDPQSSRKRFRTKFSQDQKDKMMEFAEKLGWRIQKQDEQEVKQFCAQVGVKRQVFKVWMHNNKQAMKKKQM